MINLLRNLRRTLFRYIVRHSKPGWQRKYLYARIKPYDIAMLPGRWGNLTVFAFVDGIWKKLPEEIVPKTEWEFLPDEVLIEHHPNGKSWPTVYYYDQTECEICIDYSDYTDDGFISICYEEHFRIARLTTDELWLYDGYSMDYEEECVYCYRFLRRKDSGTQKEAEAKEQPQGI